MYYIVYSYVLYAKLWPFAVTFAYRSPKVASFTAFATFSKIKLSFIKAYNIPTIVHHWEMYTYII
jgi:hypothetical protein